MSQSKSESQEESAESGSEIDATVEFHETDDDDGQRRSKKSGTLELNTDIFAPNTTSTVTYELRQRKPRKYQQELECELDEDMDELE